MSSQPPLCLPRHRPSLPLYLLRLSSLPLQSGSYHYLLPLALHSLAKYHNDHSHFTAILNTTRYIGALPRLLWVFANGSSPGSGALGLPRVFSIAQPSIGQIGAKFGEVLSVYSICLRVGLERPIQVVFELAKGIINCGVFGCEGCCIESRGYWGIRWDRIIV